MSNEFIEKISLVLHNENASNKIQFPPAVKNALRLIHGDLYQNAITYNDTVCFTSININGELIEDERVVVPPQPYLFLYSSNLQVDNHHASFTFSWDNLLREPTAKENLALSEYVSAIFGRQLCAILFALSFSQQDTMTIMIKLGSMGSAPIQTERMSVKNRKLTLTTKNTLPLGGSAEYCLEVEF